jgi:predicted transposase/invertase (TIGR01784 family)
MGKQKNISAQPLIRKLKSPHDSFFQIMMEKVDVAKDFFQAWIRKEVIQAIDFDTLQIADSVRRAPNRKPTYTDITYHALTRSKGNVYLHLEQERGIDPGMVERILHYNARLYAKHRNQGHAKLPLILNLVVYNGIKEDYPYYEDISEYYEEPELARLVTGKPFQVINLTKEKDEGLLSQGASGLMQVLLKRASLANFTEWMEANKESLRKLPVGAYLNIGVEYALSVGKGKAEEIINSFMLVYPQLKDVIMTAARQLEKRGEKRGIEKGIEKGIQQGKLAIAKNMLKLSLDLKLIQEATGLSQEIIGSLKQK